MDTEQLEVPRNVCFVFLQKGKEPTKYRKYQSNSICLNLVISHLSIFIYPLCPRNFLHSPFFAVFSEFVLLSCS